jgi:hypothetical protein
MDTLFEAFARFLADTLLEFFVVRLGYWPGWLICKIVTLGRYPDKAVPHNRYFVGWIPWLIAVAALTVHMSKR